MVMTGGERQTSEECPAPNLAKSQWFFFRGETMGKIRIHCKWRFRKIIGKYGKIHTVHGNFNRKKMKTIQTCVDFPALDGG